MPELEDPIQDLRNPPVSIGEMPDHVPDRLCGAVEIKRVAGPENIGELTHYGISQRLIGEMLAGDSTDSVDQSRQARTCE